MPTDPKRPCSEAEFVSLREYLEARLAALEKSSEARLAALEKRIELAAGALDKRLDTMNEIREQLNQQANTFLPRETYDSRHDLLTSQVRELQEFRAVVNAKASQGQVMLSTILGAIGLVVAVVVAVVQIAQALRGKP